MYVVTLCRQGGLGIGTVRIGPLGWRALPYQIPTLLVKGYNTFLPSVGYNGFRGCFFFGREGSPSNMTRSHFSTALGEAISGLGVSVGR